LLQRGMQKEMSGITDDERRIEITGGKKVEKI
jgi:hypothetical protein